MRGFDWPILLTHEKCSQEDVVVNDITIRRDGTLTINCFCWGCNDEFKVKFSMIELVARAILDDKDLTGILNQPHLGFTPKPN